MATVAAWLRDCWHREDVPVGLQIAPPDEARPPVPAAYMPLFTYLDRRYAATVVLTFEQIEALLGFAPPSPGLADAEWWTAPGGASDQPRRCMDRRASQRSPATECANRGV